MKERSLVNALLSEVADIEDHDRDDDDQQDDGQGAGPPKIAEIEHLDKHTVGNDFCIKLSAGHDKNNIENFQDRDKYRGADGQDRRRDHRDDHPEKYAELIGAIDPGRLDNLSRYGLECGREHNHAKAGLQPDHDLSLIHI